MAQRRLDTVDLSDTLADGLGQPSGIAPPLNSTEPERSLPLLLNVGKLLKRKNDNR